MSNRKKPNRFNNRKGTEKRQYFGNNGFSDSYLKLVYPHIWTNTRSKITVTYTSALKSPSFYRGKNMISRYIAGLPVDIVEKGDGYRKKIEKHPIREILDIPNPAMNWEAFIKHLIDNAILKGNGYAQIIRTTNTRSIAGLEPRVPEQISVGFGEYEDLDGEFRNIKLFTWNKSNGNKEIIPYYDMVHVYDDSYDGISGRSILEVAAEAIGMEISLIEHGATFFGNAATPSGILSTPNKLDEQTRDAISEAWHKSNAGDNAHKTAILGNGWDFKPMSVTHDKAQYIESRRMAISDIARYLNIPPVLLLDGESTFNNQEAAQIQFRQDAIKPWVKILRSELEHKLFKNNGEKNLTVKFNFRTVIETEVNTETDVLVKQKAAGAISTNEFREKLDLEPWGPEFDEPTIMPSQMSPFAKPDNNSNNQDGENGSPRNVSDSPETRAEVDTPSESIVEETIEDKAKESEIRAIFEPILSDSLKACLSLELTQIRKLVKKSRDDIEALQEGIKAFYEQYRSKFSTKLENPINGYFRATSIEKPLEEIIDVYVSKSRGAILGASKENIEAIEALLSEWEEKKVDNMLKEIIGE